MKISNLSKLVAAGVLSAGVAVLPLNLPASAQTNTTTTDTIPAPGVDNTVVRTVDDGFDWGWLGLLGLAGLAGLIPRKQQPTAYRDPNDVGSTTYRS
ncbi:MAG: WGxxGxxG family protein [Coleofasciculaceae cyanobacterium]